MIEFQNVSKIFKTKECEVKALENVSLTIEDGDIYGIIGFSGAGKSTLIRTINALEVPTSGKVLVDGEDINALKQSKLRQKRKKIGMIFQQFNLLETKTVYENIALPLVLNQCRMKGNFPEKYRVKCRITVSPARECPAA